jgi:hypothetical protein
MRDKQARLARIRAAKRELEAEARQAEAARPPEVLGLDLAHPIGDNVSTSCDRHCSTPTVCWCSPIRSSPQDNTSSSAAGLVSLAVGLLSARSPRDLSGFQQEIDGHPVV